MQYATTASGAAMLAACRQSRLSPSASDTRAEHVPCRRIIALSSATDAGGRPV